MSLINILKKKSNTTLYTTPSHDSNLCIMHKFYQWYKNDISEVDAYNPQEALKCAEEFAAKIYNTKSTHFLTNGSTSGIIAAVLTCCKKNDNLLIWNKAHPCHRNAGILAGVNIFEYELPFNEEWGIYEQINIERLNKLFSNKKYKAVIITSPSYEGIITDVKAVSKICKAHNVKLIIDEAHGALYPFSDKLPQTAIPYADYTVQSLHKTAGGINPTALLHCNCELSPIEALKIITTTSPSYPMLATIEANIKYLNSKRGRKTIDKLISNIINIKSKLNNIEFYGDDITKLLIKKQGYSGNELSDILYEKCNIEDERANEKSLLLLTGLGTTEAKLKKLIKLNKI